MIKCLHDKTEISMIYFDYALVIDFKF